MKYYVINGYKKNALVSTSQHMFEDKKKAEDFADGLRKNKNFSFLDIRVEELEIMDSDEELKKAV